jgi:hypothetical protein
LAAPRFLPLLKNPECTVWLVHCEVWPDHMTAEVGLFEAGLEDDWQMVDGSDAEGQHQILVQIPAETTAQQVRTKGYQLKLPVRTA